MGEGDLYCSSAGSYPEGERKSATTKCKNEEIKNESTNRTIPRGHG